MHYFAEAGRLAFADRDFYVADPDFVKVPVRALLDPAYLRGRGALIQPDRSMKVALPGDPRGKLLGLGRDAALEQPSTSHLVAVDARGDAISMTTTIENEFGSKIFVRGFLLNNEMTDFSSAFKGSRGPARGQPHRTGQAPAQHASAHDRPARRQALHGGRLAGRQRHHQLRGQDAGGRAGLGPGHPGRDLAANMGSRNKDTELEKGTALEALAPALEAMGHPLRITEVSQRHPRHRDRAGRLAGWRGSAPEGLARAARRAAPLRRAASRPLVPGRQRRRRRATWRACATTIGEPTPR